MITVVMGVYNSEKYLAIALDSLIAQTKQVEKIILVNDQSTDGSLAICRFYEKKYNYVKVVQSSKRCPGGSRNVGLAYVTTKYVYFMDSDDYIVPNALEKLYHTCEKYQLDMAIGDSCHMDTKGRTYQRYSSVLKESPVMNGAATLEFALNSSLRGVNVWANLYRTSLFTTNRIYFEEQTPIDDLLTFFIISLYVKKAKYIPFEVYYYRQHPTSIIRSKRDWAEVYFDGVKRILAFIAKENIPVKKYPYLPVFICYIIGEIISFAYVQKESKKYAKKIRNTKGIFGFIVSSPKRKQRFLLLLYICPRLLGKILTERREK